MRVTSDIKIRLKEFHDICNYYNVKSLYAFGSAVRDDFDDESSDVDLLVEIDDTDPIGKGEKLMNLWDHLEDFFKRKVDLLTEPSIKNPVLKATIDRTKVLIYDGKSKKVSV